VSAIACTSAGQPGDGGDLIVVSHKAGASALLRVDAETGEVEARVPIGNAGHEVAVSADGRTAYVPIYGDGALGQPGSNGSSVDIVDLATMESRGSIDLKAGVRPHQAALARDGMLWVTAEQQDAVLIVNPARRQIVDRIELGQPQAHMLALSPDGRRAYTANVSAGTVSVIDVSQRRLLDTIRVAARVQRISVSPDSRWVFTHDNEAPRVAVIDAQTNRIARWFDLPDRAYASAVTPDGSRLIAVSPFARALYAIDLATGLVERTLPLSAACGAIVIAPGGERAWLSCGSGVIPVVNLASMRVERELVVGPGIDGLALLAVDPTR
jgi:YVTN family beta-propeller protein